MSRQAPVQAVQAQHGDQQRTHAQVRSREPLQVSLRNCQCLAMLISAILLCAIDRAKCVFAQSGRQYRLSARSFFLIS